MPHFRILKIINDFLTAVLAPIFSTSFHDTAEVRFPTPDLLLDPTTTTASPLAPVLVILVATPDLFLGIPCLQEPSLVPVLQLQSQEHCTERKGGFASPCSAVLF